MYAEHGALDGRVGAQARTVVAVGSRQRGCRGTGSDLKHW